MSAFTIPVRVYYEDVDIGGVVYYVTMFVVGEVKVATADGLVVPTKAVYLRGELDPSLARLHNRVEDHPEAPKRKPRRPRKAKQLPAIFEDPMLPGLGVDAALETPRPPTSHPAPPSANDPLAPNTAATEK